MAADAFEEEAAIGACVIAEEKKMPEEVYMEPEDFVFEPLFTSRIPDFVLKEAKR